MQQFEKFVIEREPGVYVSIDGGETKSFHNTKMWSNIERAEDTLNVVWKPGQFIFNNIPHHMTGKMELIGPYADKIVEHWIIRKIIITATVDCVDE